MWVDGRLFMLLFVCWCVVLFGLCVRVPRYDLFLLVFMCVIVLLLCGVVCVFVVLACVGLLCV